MLGKLGEVALILAFGALLGMQPSLREVPQAPETPATVEEAE